MEKKTKFDVVPLEEVLKIAVPIDEAEVLKSLPSPDHKSAVKKTQFDGPERR